MKEEVYGYVEAKGRAEHIKQLVYSRLMAEVEHYGDRQTTLIRIPYNDLRTMKFLLDPTKFDEAFTMGYEPRNDSQAVPIVFRMFGVVVEGYYGDYVQLLHEMEHRARKQ